ncbi:MAG: hypothetical protein ACI37P_05465, partial [Eggerthellaceae bacterium]
MNETHRAAAIISLFFGLQAPEVVVRRNDETRSRHRHAKSPKKDEESRTQSQQAQAKEGPRN